MSKEKKDNILSPVTSPELIKNWDTSVVDLNRNGGMFLAHDVRLRDCSLHYSNSFSEYYLKYDNVTYGIHDIYNIKQIKPSN